MCGMVAVAKIAELLLHMSAAGQMDGSSAYPAVRDAGAREINGGFMATSLPIA